MQTGWLIYNKIDAKQNKSYIDWFQKEAEQQNICLKLILREHLMIGIMNNERKILYKQSPVNPPDFAVIRTIEPMLNQFLETQGVRVFNSSNVSHLCNHKAITHYEISKLNIPMVDTYFFKKKDLTDSPPLPYPFIMKGSNGRSGKQVYLIQSDDDWNQHRINIRSDDLLIQTCNVQLGIDIRVFVIGKEIIGAVKRENKQDFRANFKLGGTAKWYPLNQQEAVIIHKIIQNYHFDLVGIDFLLDKDGNFLFNEIEDVVGSRTLSATSNINLLHKYVLHIKNELTK